MNRRVTTPVPGDLRPTTTALALASALVIVTFLAACGANTSSQGPEGGAPVGTTPETSSDGVPGVLFPGRPPGGVDMMSEIRGGLVLDGRGCLRVNSGGTDSVVIWPAGFGIEGSGRNVRVLDGEGEIVARVGRAIYMGGGQASPVGVAGLTRRELRERCPGPFWIAAPPVRIPSRAG